MQQAQISTVIQTHGVIPLAPSAHTSRCCVRKGIVVIGASHIFIGTACMAFQVSTSLICLMLWCYYCPSLSRIDGQNCYFSVCQFVSLFVPSLSSCLVWHLMAIALQLVIRNVQFSKWNGIVVHAFCEISCTLRTIHYGCHQRHHMESLVQRRARSEKEPMVKKRKQPVTTWQRLSYEENNWYQQALKFIEHVKKAISFLWITAAIKIVNEKPSKLR